MTATKPLSLDSARTRLITCMSVPIILVLIFFQNYFPYYIPKEIPT